MQTRSRPAGAYCIAMPPTAPTLLTLSLSLLVSSAAMAQSPPQTSDNGFEDLPPLAQAAVEPVPNLAFDLEAEIGLPGPLPGPGPRLRDGRIEIDVASGTVVTSGEPGAQPVPILEAETGARIAPEPGAWVEDEAGRARYRAVPGGYVEAQHRCPRCKAGWKRVWRLRVPGNTLSPPVIAGRRLYFGALDNRVYCLRTRNGHTVWAADIGGRPALPLELWRPPAGPAPVDRRVATSNRGAVLLAIPDGGTRLLALDAETGRQVASLRLEEGEGKLVSRPLATPDGRIVVARQRYIAEDASLLVYRLTAVSATAAAVRPAGAAGSFSEPPAGSDPP
jgi:hypothetical protein